MTTISDSELEIFSQLANPAKVKVNEVPSTMREASPPRIQPIEEIEEVLESRPASPPPPLSPPAPIPSPKVPSPRPPSESPFESFIQSATNKRKIPPLPVLRDNAHDLEALDKSQVLMDMQRLKMQGVQMSREWTVHDNLDDMKFEVRRHMLHIDEMNNINMMRDGMRLACSGFEMLNARMGFLELDGWASEVCADMDKYDNAFGRIYRKYWRRSAHSSPEMEIAMGVIASVGMHHFKAKMQKGMFQKGRPAPAASNPIPPPNRPKQSYNMDSDSEDEPPN